MRRMVLVLAVLALALPIAAWSDTIEMTNQNGTVSISNSGVVSKGSHLHSFDLNGNDVVAKAGGGLGLVNFGTGALASGSVLGGGTFSAVGSFFTIIGTGGYKNQGVPTGTIFSGSFVGPITWTLLSQVKGLSEFQLTGDLSGMLWNGRNATGSTTQYIYMYRGQWLKDGRGGIHFGITGVNTVPEPGTLALLGTGLVGIATVVRRKFVS